MQTVLTEKEKATLEEMRLLLAKTFGVTVSGAHVSLRFSDKSVHMDVREIVTDSSGPSSCFMCGGSYDLRPATVTIQHEGCTKPYVYEDRTCSDCRCPK
jgi:hypothetical protein